SHKMRSVKEIMNKEKIAALALLETRLTDAQIAEIEQSPYGQGLEIYSTALTGDAATSSCGVAMVFNRNLTNVEGIECYEVIPGRALLLVHPWHGSEVETILAVYAPTKKPANGLFWDEILAIWKKYKLPIPTKILGDENVTLAPIDTLPHTMKRESKSSRESLQNLLEHFELNDGWRDKHLNEKDYTFITKSRQSRIDRIYSSSDTMKQCRNWTIDDCAGSLSDHRMVSVEVYSPNAPYKGKGRYTMRPFSMDNEGFLQEAERIGIEAQMTVTNWSPSIENKRLPQAAWKTAKDQWKETERDRAKKI
ncbi:Endonuclease/exonuclease/phosphatase, partial [Mycena floridula]